MARFEGVRDGCKFTDVTFRPSRHSHPPGATEFDAPWRRDHLGGEMAQSTVALLCVSSLLTWDDAMVVPCIHPASPSARSAPLIIVPPIQALAVEGVTPDLAEEGSQSARRHQHAPATGSAGQHRHQPTSTGGGTWQHQHQAASAKGSARQDRHQPASAKGGPGQHQHQPSSTNGGAQQHQH